MPRNRVSFSSLTGDQMREIEQETAHYYEQGREPGTMANLNRFRRYFTEVCTARGTTPWPAEPFDVACFLVAYCTRLESVQTIDQAHSAVRTGQREFSGTEWTKAQEAYMAMVKRGLRKRFRQPAKRKRPLTLDVMTSLVRGLDMEDLKTLQYTTLMFLAHDGCLRLKEALDLRWSDIEWVFGADGTPSAVRVRIRVSKARHVEAAETLEIGGYEVGGVYLCALRCLWVYMQDPEVLARQQGDGEAFLFPNIRTGNSALPRQAFVDWVQGRLAACGYDEKEFGGHSMRAGGATDLHEGHAPEVIARMLGRWRSREAYLIYIRLDPTKRAAAVSEAYSRAYSSAYQQTFDEQVAEGCLDVAAYTAKYTEEFS